MEGQSRGRFWLWGVPLLLLALPVLYVASLGPCAWMYKHHLMSQGVAQAAEVFYEPLSLLGDYVAPFGQFLEWYVNTCCDLPP